MKKLIALVLALVMLLAVTACGAPSADSSVSNVGGADAPEKIEEQTSEQAEETEQEQPEEQENNDPYVFNADGVEIRIMDEAEPVLAKLGEAASTFEADSCAFQGKDYFYYYDGYQLMVNDVEGVKRITSITLVDDTVKSPEGVGIGVDEAKITEAFGEPASKTEEMYTYRYNTTSLQISVKSGKVTAMVYAYQVAQ